MAKNNVAKQGQAGEEPVSEKLAIDGSPAEQLRCLRARVIAALGVNDLHDILRHAAAQASLELESLAGYLVAADVGGAEAEAILQCLDAVVCEESSELQLRCGVAQACLDLQVLESRLERVISCPGGSGVYVAEGIRRRLSLAADLASGAFASGGAS